MQRHISIALASVIGAFFLYCTDKTLLDDPVPSADAAGEEETPACCTPRAPIRTRISEGVLPLGEATDFLDVSGFRTVILQTNYTNFSCLSVTFRDKASDNTFVYRSRSKGEEYAVHGNFLRIHNTADQSCENMPFVVVGVE